MNPYESFSRQNNIPANIGFRIGIVTLILFLSLTTLINFGLAHTIIAAVVIVIAIFAMFINMFAGLIGIVFSAVGLLVPTASKAKVWLGFVLNLTALLGPFALTIFATDKVIGAMLTAGQFFSGP